MDASETQFDAGRGSRSADKAGTGGGEKPHHVLDEFDPPQMTQDQVAAGAEIDAAPAGGPEHAIDEPGLFSVLRHKHFAVFWSAAFGSFVGTWFEYIGVQWIVAERTRDTTWLATLGAAQLLPTLFLGL
ncbi:MAG TPA: hypothetical protein VF777_09835, partial [Phycisphaerales bacterium]